MTIGVKRITITMHPGLFEELMAIKEQKRHRNFSQFISRICEDFLSSQLKVENSIESRDYSRDIGRRSEYWKRRHEQNVREKELKREGKEDYARYRESSIGYAALDEVKKQWGGVFPNESQRRDYEVCKAEVERYQAQHGLPMDNYLEVASSTMKLFDKGEEPI